ncbi:hypothetical protein Sjap_008847 [Stephania japonica]|uniref:Uncharacterized protein n=1 Tax=Stephania japonica TaxID=461633 RepID=A0AAP0JQC8_9MAGN
MLVSAPVAHLLLFHVRHHYHSKILRYVMECLLVLLISICQRFIFMFFTVFCFEEKKKKA